MTLVRQLFSITLQKPRPAAEVQKALVSAGLSLTDRLPDEKGEKEKAVPLRMSHTPTHYFATGDLAELGGHAGLAKRTGLPVRGAMPVYRMSKDLALCSPKEDVLFVQVDPAKAPAVVALLAGQHYEFDGAQIGPWARAVRKSGAVRADEIQTLLGTTAAHELDVTPLVSAACSAAVPADPLFNQAWSEIAVGAISGFGGAVSPRKGSLQAYLAIVDPSGVAVNTTAPIHVDLDRPGNKGFDQTNGSFGLVDVSVTTNAHGTALAGVAVAKWDDTDGTAGIAPSAGLYAVRPQSESSGDVALMLQIAGHPRAADPVDSARGYFTGEQVVPGDKNIRTVLLYGATAVWAGGVFDAAIAELVAAGAMLVAPSGNSTGGSTAVVYPATRSDVLAVGATGPNVPAKINLRVENESPSGVLPSDWSSCFGPELDLTAPGHSIVTTDLVGDAGYNTTAVGTADLPDRSFTRRMEGTSIAAAHVAGIVALFRATYVNNPALDVRDILLRSAIKINASGGTPYVYGYATPGDSRRRCNDVGYGRAHAGNALTDADVWISDGPGDIGNEDSGVAAFWADSDILSQVVSPNSPAPWSNHADALAQFDAQRVQTAVASNFDTLVYVRIRNRGPGVARNVQARLVLCSPGTGFHYPGDWKATEDTDHIVAAPEPWPIHGVSGDLYTVDSLPAGQAVIARFRVTAAQGVKGIGWNNHPCALAFVRAAGVTSDPDYTGLAPALADPNYPGGIPVGVDHSWADFEASFLTDAGGQQAKRNNLVQRNMHTVLATSPWKFGFFVGSPANPDEEIELVVDLHGLPLTRALLSVNDLARAFPRHPALAGGRDQQVPTLHAAGPRVTLLDDTRVRVEAGGLDGVLTVKAGTHFDVSAALSTVGVRLAAPADRIDVTLGKHGLSLAQRTNVLRIRRAPGDHTPVYLEIPVPAGATKGQAYLADLIERDRKGRVVGGIRLRLIA